MADEREQARVDSVDARWQATFDDRYGAGSCRRLVAQLGQPCVTFAEIAKEIGVSRERVRQWQLLLLPEAPRGHERQRLCGLHHQKRRLLQDALFRAFYRHARPHFDAGRIGLVKAGDGYRTRSVTIDGRTVAIKDASRPAADGESPNVVRTIVRYTGAADFVYVRLTGDDYLVLPAKELRLKPLRLVDGLPPGHHPFKNTFAALQAGGVDRVDRRPDSLGVRASG